MILLIDNYDSFTYNIYQYLSIMNYSVNVKRNDEITIQEIEKLNPERIIISPGPSRPENAGISNRVIEHFKDKIPILGICLGNECIGYVFGAKIVKASKIYHGKTSEIIHDGKGIFKGIKNGFIAARYHSLVIDKSTLPQELEISALSEDGDIMGVRHKKYNIEGLQFHPESIATEYGFELFKNFLENNVKIPSIVNCIKKIKSGEELSEYEAIKVMEEMSEGQATPIQISSLLTALSIKGESVNEITGFAKVMREKVKRVNKPKNKKIIDTCGTGGDGANTFNISTISSFVSCGAGVTIAKHGNRSVTSKCGSADLLEALGININTDEKKASQFLDEVGFAFMFAPLFHNSIKNVVPVRREIGIRTIFNIIGPLTNPANADFHIIGVYEKKLVNIISRVLINLGIKRAMVVHGSDGLDEITLTGITYIDEIKNDWVYSYEFDPKLYGFKYCSTSDVIGGDINTNKTIALDILNGKKCPQRDIVVLNSAAAIYLVNDGINFKEAIKIAEDSIDSGKALNKLNQLIELTNE